VKSLHCQTTPEEGQAPARNPSNRAIKRRRSLRSVKVRSVRKTWPPLCSKVIPNASRPNCYGRSAQHRGVAWNRRSRSAVKVRLVERRWCPTRYESAQKRTLRQSLVPQGLWDLNQLRATSQNVICEEKVVGSVQGVTAIKHERRFWSPFEVRLVTNIGSGSVQETRLDLQTLPRPARRFLRHKVRLVKES
jgi:hypothetical protein